MCLLGEMVKGQCEAFSKIVSLHVGLEVRIVFRLDVEVRSSHLSFMHGLSNRQELSKFFERNIINYL